MRNPESEGLAQSYFVRIARLCPAFKKKASFIPSLLKEGSKSRPTFCSRGLETLLRRQSGTPEQWAAPAMLIDAAMECVMRYTGTLYWIEIPTCPDKAVLTSHSQNPRVQQNLRFV